MKLEWKDSYRLGDDMLDQQHRRMFELANATCDANEQVALRLAAYLQSQ